jgi:hypothetical protein
MRSDLSPSENRMTATNMDSMLRSGLAITLIGTALVVAACGSDDGSTPTGAGATGGTGATGGAGAIPVPPVAGAGNPGAGGTASGPSSGGGSGASGQRRSQNGSDRSRQRDNRRGSSGGETTPRPGSSGSPTQTATPPSVSSDAAAFKLAKEICANVTLEGVALNLRISLQERDAAFVARAYSRSYPASHRDAAYKGCLEGFRSPVRP